MSARSGLRWLVLAVVVKLPWSRRSWALPCLSVLLTTPKVSQQLGQPSQDPGSRGRSNGPVGQAGTAGSPAQAHG